MNDENAPAANEQPTTSDNQPSPAASSDDETTRIERLARTYRHIGYAIFGALALALAGFLFYSALVDVNNRTVIDPQTGQPFYDDSSK